MWVKSRVVTLERQGPQLTLQLQVLDSVLNIESLQERIQDSKRASAIYHKANTGQNTRKVKSKHVREVLS
jgi:hypothetical protein